MLNYSSDWTLWCRRLVWKWNHSNRGHVLTADKGKAVNKLINWWILHFYYFTSFHSSFIKLIFTCKYFIFSSSSFLPNVFFLLIFLFLLSSSLRSWLTVNSVTFGNVINGIPSLSPQGQCWISSRSWNFLFLESQLSPKTCYFLTGSMTNLRLFQNRFLKEAPVVSVWEDHWHIWCWGSVCHVDQTNKIWCGDFVGPWVSEKRSRVVKHTNLCVLCWSVGVWLHCTARI